MGRLDGKNALVTGASRGIGRAIALQLIRDGAKVALNYRSGEAECRGLADEISGIGGEVLPVRAGVCHPQEARRAACPGAGKSGGGGVLVAKRGATRAEAV